MCLRLFTQMVPLVPRFLEKKRSATKMGLTKISKTNAAEKLHSTSRDTKTSRRHQQGHTQNENKNHPTSPRIRIGKNLKTLNTRTESRRAIKNKPVCCSPQLFAFSHHIYFPTFVLCFFGFPFSFYPFLLSSFPSSALSHGFVFFDLISIFFGQTTSFLQHCRFWQCSTNLFAP